MVALSIVICSKTAKIIFARQFIQITRRELEEYVVQFSRNIDSCKEITHFESDKVRYIFIPIDAFLDVDLPIDKIIITTSNDITLTNMDIIHSKIQYQFPNAEIEDPIKRNFAFEEALKDTDVLSLVMLLLAMLTESYLMLYLRQKCNHEYGILKVLGSTSRSNTILHAASTTVSLLFQSVIGSILFYYVIHRCQTWNTTKQSAFECALRGK